jgi:hypothetical protein
MNTASLTLRYSPQANVDATFPTTVRNFAIHMPSFATSGYSWYVLRNPSRPETWNIVYRNRDVSQCPPGVVGCSGTEIYNLYLTAAPKPDEVIQVPFVLARPFELDANLAAPTHFVFRLKFRAV